MWVNDIVHPTSLSCSVPHQTRNFYITARVRQHTEYNSGTSRVIMVIY
jgi:hypothetical protein